MTAASEAGIYRNPPEPGQLVEVRRRNGKPTTYRTLAGLLKATERALRKREAGLDRLDGQSMGMWLYNAEY